VVSDLGRRAPDLVVHGGDLALMGPRPAEVVDVINALGWPGVVGNADELLWRPEEHGRRLDLAPKLAAVLAALFDVYAPDTSERLGDARIARLRDLPYGHIHRPFVRALDDLCVINAGSVGMPWDGDPRPPTCSSTTACPRWSASTTTSRPRPEPSAKADTRTRTG